MKPRRIRVGFDHPQHTILQRAAAQARAILNSEEGTNMDRAIRALLVLRNAAREIERATPPREHS